MPRRPLQRIQAITVARRYFIERQTKSRIAQDLAISRFKVARLIDEAIEEGLVRFEIDEAGELDARLSDRLREKYSLHSALVLAGPDLPCSALIEPARTNGSFVARRNPDRRLRPRRRMGPHARRDGQCDLQISES
jgi:DNA-binding transcriptional regulator LsrR (DeoR family)